MMTAFEPEEARVRESLQTAGATYEWLLCDPALADTAVFCEHYGISPDRSANTIIVASKKEPKLYAACLVLATSRLDVNRAVSDLMGVKRLSFATADETMTLTGMLVGGVTVFGLPAGIPIYIDARVMLAEDVVVGGGSRSAKVRVVPDCLRRLPGAVVVEGLAVSRDAAAT